MQKSFDFNDMFVFDLANNHQGSVDHAIDIIKEVGAVARKHKVRGVFKFQFRQMDSFIHKAHKNNSDNKHIPRFLATRLTTDQYKKLLSAVRDADMLAMCTPFDEESVDLITDMGFDLIKVASCSATDWPLLEKVAESGLPVVFSTGGLALSKIDDLVSFFDHRGCDYAIMHCVSIYPIPEDKFQLSQIEVFRQRYRNRVIGWSTHEDPDATLPIQIAVSKGARIFERHVGKETDEITLNAYSSTPDQLDRWIAAYHTAIKLCGSTVRTPNTEEIDSINSLRRGVFAKKPIKSGQKIDRDMVYFAMPYQEGQLQSGTWKDNIIAHSTVAEDQPLMLENLEIPHNPEHHILKQAIHEVKALLNEARIPLNSEFEVEYSHHYGMENFYKYGAVIINCINREYCKKIIVQLPGQKHPFHFHKLKEETFQILHGELHTIVDGYERLLRPGETSLVMPGVWHSFWTETGCVFEEVSTTHYNNDSVYKDKKIAAMERSQRKTVVDHWGRFQLSENISKVNE